MKGADVALHLYLAYVATCIVIVIVPGPTVTLIVANSMRHGARADLLTCRVERSASAMIGIGSAILRHDAAWAWFDWVGSGEDYLSGSASCVAVLDRWPTAIGQDHRRFFP